MKHTKKLIPAIGMLLLSACMLVTSTFAWFSMNTTVKATGMSVSAKGDQVYLQIVNSGTAFDDDAAQIIATAQEAFGQNLKPTNVVKSINTPATSCVAYDGGKDFVWVDASSATVDAWQAAGSGYKAVTYNGYALLKSFDIRLNAKAGKTEATAPLKASSVQFTPTEGKDWTSDAFASCVSVLVVCGNNSQLFKQTTAGNFEEVSGSDDYLDAANVAAEGQEAKYVFNNTSGVKVDVYVFFNGDNENCTIANLNNATLNAAGYAVDVFFTCA